MRRFVSLPLVAVLAVALAAPAVCAADRPDAGAPGASEPRLRIERTQPRRVIEVAGDGTVTAEGLAPARLDAEERLLFDGGRHVLRVDANGDLLDGNEVFGHFEGDDTLWIGNEVMLTIDDQGRVSGSQLQFDPVSHTRRVRKRRDDFLRVQAKDAADRKLALFVFAGMARGTVYARWSAPPGPTTQKVAVGLAALLVGWLSYRVMAGDVAQYRYELRRRLEKKVDPRREPSLDATCRAAGHRVLGYRYRAGTSEEREQLAQLRDCARQGPEPEARFCCPDVP